MDYIQRWVSQCCMWRLSPIEIRRQTSALKKSVTEFADTFSAIRLCLLLSLFLLELQVPVVHDSPCQLVDGCSLISSEAQDVNGTLATEK